MEHINLPQGLPAFMINESGKVRLWNKACEQCTGIRAAALLNTAEHWQAFYAAPHPMLADLLLKNDIMGIESQFGTTLVYHEDGESCSGLITIDKPLPYSNTLWTQAFLLRGPDGEPSGALQIFQPVELAQFMEGSPIVKALIDKFPVPVAVVARYKIVHVNMAYARLTGHAHPSDLVGTSPAAFIDPEDKEKFDTLNSNIHAHIESGKTYRWKMRIGNRLRYWEGSPVVIPWGNSRALISTISDVTEKVEEEQNRSAREANLLKDIAHLLEELQSQNQIRLGESPLMRQTLSQALQLAKLDTNLVIHGETGTGKSLVARLVHESSQRRQAPFIMVNCAAIPRDLLESEFFGHVRGSFTGAHTDTKGFISAADQGTLFLDEVAELTLPMQAKLLNFIETRQYFAVGDSRPRQADVRLICATNKDLAAMVRSGELREDFYYRIFVVDLRIPALRERREDIPGLIEFFFKKFNPLDSNVHPPAELLRKLMVYDWPGNIRELQNVILRYLATGVVQFRQMEQQNGGTEQASSLELAPELKALAAETAARPEGVGEIDFCRIAPKGASEMQSALDEVRRKFIIQALKQCGDNKVLAARKLDMNLRTFHRHCARLGLQRRMPE